MRSVVRWIQGNRKTLGFVIKTSIKMLYGFFPSEKEIKTNSKL